MQGFISKWLRFGAAWLAALACLYTTTALAQAPTVERQDALRQVQDAPKRGLLYEIRTKSNTVYLFGTIHVGKPEFYPLNLPVTQALSSSKRLYLEADISDTASVTAAVNKWAFYPAGTTLDQKLSPSLMKRVREKLALYKMPADAALRTKPWMVAQAIILGDASQAGYDPDLAVELYLSGLATGLRKEIKGLETLDEQFAMFDAISEADQATFLDEVITEVEGGGGRKELVSLAHAWASADAAGLESARKLAMDAPPVGRKLMARLVDERNLILADRIAEIVRTGPPSFVAIGALHLVGPDSVVELLRKRGFKLSEL
jgi:uncharacterized protein